MKTGHACAPVTAPRTWPSFATSRSIWCVKSTTSDPSSDAANAPLGTPNTCWKSWDRCAVNLDSLPWSSRPGRRDPLDTLVILLDTRMLVGEDLWAGDLWAE